MPSLLEFPPEAIDQDELAKDVCRASFRDFVKMFWHAIPGAGKLIWGWHIDIFCQELQIVAERVFAGIPAEYDLVCNVSPGTSKSSVFSILFQPWTWTRMPHARHINASHTESLVLDLANKSRAVINSDLYQTLFPEIELRYDQDTKGYFANTLGGCRYACTVGGKSPMGMHAHFLNGDDLLDPQKVLSEVERQTAKEFVENGLPTRMTDKRVSVISIVSQRLGKGDQTDVMIEVGNREGARHVRHLCMPCDDSWPIYPTDEEFTIYREGNRIEKKTLPEMYEEGEGLMDPIRLPADVLKAYRARGEYYYAGQFGQSPRLRGGGMFKEGYFLNKVRSAPFNSERVRFWDRAATSDGGCATAGVLIGKHDDRYYVEDVVWGQWEPNERNNQIVATAHRDRIRYGRHEPTHVIEAERGSTGLESYQRIAGRLAGFKVKEDMPSGSKDVRAEPFADQCAAGNVFIVDNGEHAGLGKATWDVNAYIRELVDFRPLPGKRIGGRCDRVDASSGSFNLLSGRKKAGSLYILGTGVKKGMLKIVVVSREELTDLVITDHFCLLVLFEDPPYEKQEPAFGDTSGKKTKTALKEEKNGVAVGAIANGQNPPDATGMGADGRVPQKYGLSKLLDTLTLTFADLDPKDLQDVWHDPVEPWGKLPSELIMTLDHGKKLWGCLTKKRMPPAEIWVLCDEGGEDGRALSAAMAMCELLRLPRQQTIHVVSSPEMSHDGEPGNQHVFNQVKASRGLVM